MPYRLGKWEKMILIALLRTPEYIRMGAVIPYTSRDYYGSGYLTEDDEQRVESGNLVHSTAIKWGISGDWKDICKSTLSRTLKVLEEKELILSLSKVAGIKGDRFSIGIYSKYFLLTREGVEVAEMLTSAKCKS